jgi:hypothetical protein
MNNQHKIRWGFAIYKLTLVLALCAIAFMIFLSAQTLYNRQGRSQDVITEPMIPNEDAIVLCTPEIEHATDSIISMQRGHVPVVLSARVSLDGFAYQWELIGDGQALSICRDSGKLTVRRRGQAYVRARHMSTDPNFAHSDWSAPVLLVVYEREGSTTDTADIKGSMHIGWFVALSAGFASLGAGASLVMYFAYQKRLRRQAAFRAGIDSAFTKFKQK